MKGKIILVEGPDCTGKTTLCNQLINRHSFYYKHLTRPVDVESLYIQLIKELKKAKKTGMNIVIDRAYISNIVYANVFQDAGVLSNKLRLKINKLVDMIIICLPSNKLEYLKKFNGLKESRKELYNDMEKVYDEFEKSFNLAFLKHKKVLRYNYQLQSLDTLDQYVDQEIISNL